MREKASGHSKMSKDKSKHSESGTSKTDHSQPEHQQSNGQDLNEQSSPFQEGLMSAEVERTRKLTPSDLRRDSLLNAIDSFHERERKTRTVKVKARKLK